MSHLGFSSKMFPLRPYVLVLLMDVRPLQTTHDQRLDAAAVKVFRQWRFRPRTLKRLVAPADFDFVMAEPLPSTFCLGHQARRKYDHAYPNMQVC